MHKYIIPYFLLLAILVGGMGALHMKPTMPTILTSMAVAGIVLAGIRWIGKLINRKMDQYGLSKKQWAAVMIGHSPNAFQVVDAARPQDTSDYTSPTNGVLVPRQNLYPVPYQPEDEEDLPEFIIEPDGMHLSETFQPRARALYGMTVLILGIRRFGKSNCIAVLIEELARAFRNILPMLICDTKGEYDGLVNPGYLPHGYMVGAPGGREKVAPEVQRAYISVDEKGALAFGKAIMEGHLQVVLNLKTYADDDEAARVMCKIIQGINAWEEARPNEDRVPVEVVLDEAHKWLPQNLGERCVLKETQDLLHHTFFSTIVRLGGAYGFGLILATQRVVELDKRALQSLWQFLFLQTVNTDLDYYKAKGIPRDEVLSLRPGECFVFSPLVLGFRMMIRRRHSPDLSRTPGLEQLERHNREAMAKRELVARRGYADHPSASVPVISYTARAIPTVAFENEGKEDVSIPKDEASDDEPESALTPEEQTAWEWYCKGNRSGRKLAGAMGITNDRAYKLLARLQALGYAERDGNV